MKFEPATFDFDKIKSMEFHGSYCGYILMFMEDHGCWTQFISSREISMICRIVRGNLNMRGGTFVFFLSVLQIFLPLFHVYLVIFCCSKIVQNEDFGVIFGEKWPISI